LLLSSGVDRLVDREQPIEGERGFVVELRRQAAGQLDQSVSAPLVGNRRDGQPVEQCAYAL
jgi:hypothetical protein